MGYSFGVPILTDGLIFTVDALDKNSYPGSGTNWQSLVNTNHTSSMSNVNFTSAGTLTSFDFTGTNPSRCEWNNLGSTLQAQSTGTFSIWFQYDSASGNRYFLTMGQASSAWNSNKYHLSLMADGDWFWGSYGAASRENTNVGTVLSTGTIYNICGNSDGKLYLNGNLDYTADDAFWFNNAQTIDHVHIGQLYNSGTLFASQQFDGDLYSFYIWDRALTAQEIKQNFEAQRTRFGV